MLRRDAPRIQLLFPNPNVVHYLATVVPWPYPKDGANAFLDGILPRIRAQEQYHWAIVEHEDPKRRLIGLISLFPDSDEDHRGFWLGEPYWGRGYMREAAAAVNDFAFGPLGMTELLLNNAEPNVASHRLKASTGAEILCIGEADFIGGRFPCVSWRLTAEAWGASKSVG